MKLLSSSLRALPWLVLAAGRLPALDFSGRLDPQPEPGTRALAPVVAAPAEVVAALPEAPAATDRVWTLSRPLSIKGKSYLVALQATAAGKKILWVDRDGDGKFGTGERWNFADGQTEVALTLPWDNGIYREFPLRLEYRNKPIPRPAAAGATAPADAALAVEPAPTTVTALVYNFNILYGGAVAIDGRPMRVLFAPKPADVAIDLANHRISMDANLNGTIEPALGEAENPTGRIPVFRVGARYLAVKSVDLQTGEIIVEERPASDYTRFEAAPGQVMPDFAFVDFEGRARRLADFRGKYVLLDFWGTWCGPCVEEMRHLDPVYAQYAPRGFEVIGMNMEKTAGRLSAAEYAEVNKKAADYIARAGHRWIQATQQSIERVAQEVIHVNAYPTCILIGPDGKVISREARGQTLVDLLARHLPQ